MRINLHFLLFFLSFSGVESFANDPRPSSTAIVLSINSTGTTCGRSNGRIIVTATGGTAPYTYQLNSNTPRSTGVFLYLVAGMYTVTVTDATAQTAVSTVTLTNTFTAPTGVTVQPTYPSACNAQDASLTLNGVGGTAPYTFSIDHTNFQTSNVFSNLYAGSYYCAVKDANGCESPFIWSNTTDINRNCMISEGGQVRSQVCDPFRSYLGLYVSGGVAPYQYSIDGINFQSDFVFFPLPAGLYVVTVKDAAGNVLKYAVALHDACNSVITLQGVVAQAQCGQNGSITVTATDGVGPYLYSIDGINFQTSNQFTGLSGGTYTIIVKDADGVASSKLFVVGNGCLSLTTTVASSTCGNSNGSITAQATSGTAPYQYSIDGINFTGNNQFNNLAAGTYSITVKDAIGGNSTISATVANIAGPSIYSIIATAAGCINSDGTIALATQGGTSPLQYSIDGVNFQPGSVFTGLSNGAYTAITKDANGCTGSATVTVPLNNTLTVNAGNNVTICEGQTIMLSGSSNGTSFSWSPASTLSNINILTPNASPTTTTNYTLTATAGICNQTSTVTVFVNPAPIANAGRDTTICIGKNVQLQGSGGTNFSWSPSAGLSSSTIPDPVVTNPRAGTHSYSLSVKDNNGCSSLVPSVVHVTVFSPVVFAGRDTILLMNQPFQLQAVDAGNYGFSTYTWSPPTGLNNPSIKDPVTIPDKDIKYILTATTTNGCVATDDIEIKVVNKADIYVPTGFTPNNNSLNDILKAIPVGIKEFRIFTVYNRWGQLIFQTKNALQGWDGKVNGIPQQNGVFVWIAEGISFTGEVIKRKGTVMLIR